jgi:hypothetical protein
MDNSEKVRVTIRCESILPETEEIPVETYTALQEELDAAWEITDKSD